MADFKFDEDNWHIETTDENRQILKDYFKKSGVKKDWVYRNGYTYGVRNGNFASGISNQYEITFGQFKKYVLKEEQTTEFKFPEKWYIFTTEENREVLNNWRKTKCSEQYKDSVMHVGYPVLSKHLGDDSYFVMAIAVNFFRVSPEYNDYVEINFEQFKEHVLKEKQVTEFTFDKKNWFVKFTNKTDMKPVFDYLNNYDHNGDEYWVGNCAANSCYGIRCGESACAYSWGAFELTLDQFKEHILNEKKMEKEVFTFDKNNWCFKNGEEHDSEFIHLYNGMLHKEYLGYYSYYGSLNGRDSSGFDSWGTELTLDQFKEYILNNKPFDVAPEQTKEVEFVFDKNNWSYKNNRQERSEFIKLFSKFLNYTYTGNCIYYGLSGGEKNTGTAPWGTELTFDQFKQYVLGIQTDKIIGYKTPFDLYGGEIKKETIYINAFNKNYYIPSDRENDSDCITLPKEIVETWEPVYEVKFKVGDFIWATNRDSNGLRQEGQIVEIVDNSFDDKATGLISSNTWDFIVKSSKGEYYRINSKTALARFATYKEIEDSKEFVVKVGNNEVTIRKEGIFAVGSKIDVKELRETISLLNKNLGSWNVTLVDATLKYGCWEDCKLSEIKEVLAVWNGLQ